MNYFPDENQYILRFLFHSGKRTGIPSGRNPQILLVYTFWFCFVNLKLELDNRFKWNFKLYTNSVAKNIYSQNKMYRLFNFLIAILQKSCWLEYIIRCYDPFPEKSLNPRTCTIFFYASWNLPCCFSRIFNTIKH